MKLQLKIELIEYKTVKMTLIQVCEEAMWDSKSMIESKVYQSPYTDIIISSFGNFYFDKYEIRLPQRNRFMNKLTWVHEFDTEHERYITLRKYYNTFSDWSLNIKMFPNTDMSFRKRVVINGKYWRVI